ncbi:hypothetical protein D9Q98_010457 [Chlorella vulgaris]|uniref:50S ribosomal protein L35 n=1 Tax=Chlorella vulgaris TaxID=3077 RepID=A0A9D4TRY1_CHLVU|nr:hypothetical protein D9Q98_010457 [Chlorella vulgaris]
MLRQVLSLSLRALPGAMPSTAAARAEGGLLPRLAAVTAAAAPWAACTFRTAASSSFGSSSKDSGLRCLTAASPLAASLLRSSRAVYGDSLQAALPWQQQFLRHRTDSAHIKLRFKGGKVKPYSSYKHRFKVTATGKILFPSPGYVHKRFNKSHRQLGDLSKKQVMKPRYAKTVKKLGFALRHF